MTKIKNVYNYVFDSVFLALGSTYLIYILIITGALSAFLFKVSDSSASGFAGLAFIQILFYTIAVISGLLIWRKLSRGTYLAVLKRAVPLVLVIALILVLLVAPVNYRFEVNQEIEKRNDYIMANEEYRRDPHPSFDTSVPESWIKSEEQIRRDALISSLSAAAFTVAAIFIIAPFPLIKYIRSKLN